MENSIFCNDSSNASFRHLVRRRDQMSDINHTIFDNASFESIQEVLVRVDLGVVQLHLVSHYSK